MGDTVRYDCPTNSFNGCTETGRKNAGTGGIGNSTSNGYLNLVQINHNVKLPFGVNGLPAWVTPGITYVTNIHYTPRGFQVVGTRDGVPAHQLSGGYIPGNWMPIFSHPLQCGFGDGLMGFCNVGFNVKV